MFWRLFLRQFQWFATGPVPDGCDLRRLGWTLVEPSIEPLPAEAPPLIAMPHRAVVSDWIMLVGTNAKRRRRVLAVGVEDPGERARLLRLGFGDAIGGTLDLAEIESRALRIDEAMRSLPRERALGPLRLDLLVRDAFVAGRGAGLHPREFLLLWRLAEEPGTAVSASELRSDDAPGRSSNRKIGVCDEHSLIGQATDPARCPCHADRAASTEYKRPALTST